MKSFYEGDRELHTDASREFTNKIYHAVKPIIEEYADEYSLREMIWLAASEIQGLVLGRLIKRRRGAKNE